MILCFALGRLPVSRKDGSAPCPLRSDGRQVMSDRLQKIKQLYQAAREREAGKRVAALMPAEAPQAQKAQSHVIFLENFFDEVRRRTATQAK
jgi:hypothetical protein